MKLVVVIVVSFFLFSFSSSSSSSFFIYIYIYIYIYTCLPLLRLGPDRKPSGGPAGRQSSGLDTLGTRSHNPN